MPFSHKYISGVDVIDIEDSMDLYTVPEIKKFCRNLTFKENAKILLTLKKVNFMDSSGLGMLTNIFFECKQKAIPLKLADLSGEVRRMLSLTKLDLSFPIYETQEEAIKSFD
ncbi:MAG TPA: STAS domain-containing protein [Leptospiraceae bacterium]|nr:STAS domain-containing protein [Leptospiraceae bacterium]HMW04381.1 STAS domain-containing protein [Leptospiraceae bacterium]HMX31049.1 STAS domain-containing protein [Leptospiraceae bacterium]HMY31865.1 STAS domain-containing protein [Leptospiraceae bacterium]HMZ63854.1 STAS domain-containing protein [Leptospiraceae bacterium]